MASEEAVEHVLSDVLTGWARTKEYRVRYMVPELLGALQAAGFHLHRGECLQWQVWLSGGEGPEWRAIVHLRP